MSRLNGKAIRIIIIIGKWGENRIVLFMKIILVIPAIGKVDWQNFIFKNKIKKLYKIKNKIDGR